MPSGSVTPAAGTAFNGGTIANPLTINDPTTGTELSVQGTHTDLTIDGFGDIVMNADRGTTLQLNATGAANTASVSLSGTDGGSGTWDTTSGLSFSLTAALFKLSDAGFVFGGLNAAPSSASLSAGQCALWFDQTNGAAKLMVKAKQANGTVVTGSVTLS